MEGVEGFVRAVGVRGREKRGSEAPYPGGASQCASMRTRGGALVHHDVTNHVYFSRFVYRCDFISTFENTNASVY